MAGQDIDRENEIKKKLPESLTVAVIFNLFNGSPGNI